MKLIVRRETLKSKNIAIKNNLGNSATYFELYHEAQELQNRITHRSLIILLCDYSFETVKMIYKVLSINSVPLLLSADTKIEFLNKMMNVYSPKYLWCEKSHLLTGKYISIFEENSHCLLQVNKDEIPLHEDLALLLSTSGSTGSSKLVKISYENLYNNMEYACLRCGIERDQKGITSLPLNFTMGFSFCMWHWHSGATLLITNELILSKRFSDFFTREQVNNFAAVPYTFYALDRIHFWDIEKLSYLKFAMSGGAQITDDLHKKLVSLMGKKFWIGYGQTECTGLISTANFSPKDLKLGSVGHPLPNMELQIEPANSEMILKSKSVSMGYASNIYDLSVGDQNMNILRTGDVATLDIDGCIYLKGRLNRYIKILSNRISLDETQDFLHSQFPSYEFACVGSENKISVYYSSNMKNQSTDITKKLLEKLHQIHIPHNCVKCFYLEHLPRNDSNKLMYSALNNF